ncbi:gp37 [Brochothrix phage BL3]|uniref:gp37 n=1 Tax=Brochothrix phage BL3 TaxID=764562 RepID=UPI0001D9ADCE|nr:gp37 [Brochothrix phage BL3]ADH03118.1 gp37 [Brochothrix phage BL3]
MNFSVTLSIILAILGTTPCSSLNDRFSLSKFFKARYEDSTMSSFKSILISVFDIYFTTLQQYYTK